MNQVLDNSRKILDVGCGMGGLSKILFDNGYKIESLTPDNNQKNYINNKYKDLIVHHMKFEDFSANDTYGTVINSESLQYINLNVAFEIIDKILDDN